MKLVLIHLANLVVMAHMTFGCSLHHGLGSGNACEHQDSSISCMVANHHEEDGHDHDQHDHDQQDDDDHDSDSSAGLDEAEHGHSHIGCHDDGCHVQPICEFVFNPWDFLTVAFGEAKQLVNCPAIGCPDFARSDGADDRISAPKVRSHLLVCVQLI